ncbi:MAG: hypothetical protein M3340_13915 [Actinomycetota bacterium]|nr:hypothetical protein [Actinomycetota bacterium]
MTRTPQSPLGDRPSVRADEVVVELPPTPDAGSLARRAVTSLDERLHPETMAKLRLLVTELVVAALGPAQTEGLRLTVRLDGEVVRAELGPSRAGASFARPAEPRNWGLFLVDRIADRWETAPDVVWFELSAR